jgi:hypothetical protein
MMSAISVFRKGEVSLKTAAELHIVPRCVNDTSLDPKEAVATALGRKTYLEIQRTVYSSTA